eukprot:Mycagemm_TRINITY_DN10344_c1_g4::TRINITY_DN10344_c1_g4_i5::g.752::m.752 type:complete len:101 gc:universal TRINITY_DN10344_c1_g4_i5:23-325(+)
MKALWALRPAPTPLFATLTGMPAAARTSGSPMPPRSRMGGLSVTPAARTMACLQRTLPRVVPSERYSITSWSPSLSESLVYSTLVLVQSWRLLRAFTDAL